MGGATDSNGEYFIANVPVGVYSLTASMIGYEDVTITNVHVRINGTTEAMFNLSQQALQSEEVVIVAERPPIEFDKTSTVSYLNDAQIVAQPTKVFTEVLATLPSINDENEVLKFRVGTLDQVAFIVDGGPRIGIAFDEESGRPVLNADTLETTVPGIHLAWSLTAGKAIGEIFIENGRWDGGKIFGDRAARDWAEAAYRGTQRPIGE